MGSFRVFTSFGSDFNRCVDDDFVLIFGKPWLGLSRPWGLTLRASERSVSINLNSRVELAPIKCLRSPTKPSKAGFIERTRLFTLILQGPCEQVTNNLYPQVLVSYLPLLVSTATSGIYPSFCRVVEAVQLCHPSLELCKSFIRLEQTKGFWITHNQSSTTDMTFGLSGGQNPSEIVKKRNHHSLAFPCCDPAIAPGTNLFVNDMGVRPVPAGLAGFLEVHALEWCVKALGTKRRWQLGHCSKLASNAARALHRVTQVVMIFHPAFLQNTV